jgi:hypothetical protein
MSKVYSFRLDENNPREAQAREVIEAWEIEGYSLRYIIVSAFLDQNNRQKDNSELMRLMEDIHTLLQSEKTLLSNSEKTATLSEVFMQSIRKTMKPGIGNSRIQGHPFY